MEIKVFNTAVEVSEFVAKKLIERVKSYSKLNIGFATGRTMDAIYLNLINNVKKENLSFKDCKAFAVDEYIGLKKDSSNSFEQYLNLHVFDNLDFEKSNIFIPETNLEAIDEKCQEYELKIKNAGGIDFQLLGVGLNGHIGLNEPGSSLDSRTRIVALNSSTRNSNKALFRNESVPTVAVTMGIGTILDAKECCMVATGETKAEIVQKIINGDVNSKVPATALKQHKNSVLILDKNAAKLI